MLRNMAVELASVVNHLVRYPTGIGTRWTLTPRARRPLVVLPGLADNTAVFTELRAALEACGAGPVVSFSYSPLVGTVQTAATRLAGQLEQLCEISGEQQVDLVGHSLGGLIARYYVQRLGGHARVGTAVTIGTPHRGTIAARLPSPLPLVRQLRPDSALIRELAEPAPGCTTRFVAFAGESDQVVLPSRNALLVHPDLAVRNVVVPGAGHLTLAVHRQVITEICTLFRPPDNFGCVPEQRTA
ncbi:MULTISPECIES: esterase/lipase family protein [Amycolatopsis]|uniref:Alpha/beta hydrolase fold n=2 Tax=Amycolatopsis TaxID=1813 RepID=A0A1I3V3H3_9PSEU|nr:alpha/beta fold hydrolase [Amycolatopsis sacchari]SFJ88681.1 alpha/beta hydrolase fold [Amycolatopsis sacchari]